MKFKEIKNLSKEEREKKLKELKLELIKSKASEKSGNSRAKQIRKMIARLLTLDASKKEVLNNK
jgi:ribosomal protein L29